MCHWNGAMQKTPDAVLNTTSSCMALRPGLCTDQQKKVQTEEAREKLQSFRVKENEGKMKACFKLQEKFVFSEAKADSLRRVEKVCWYLMSISSTLNLCFISFTLTFFSGTNKILVWFLLEQSQCFSSAFIFKLFWPNSQWFFKTNVQYIYTYSWSWQNSLTVSLEGQILWNNLNPLLLKEAQVGKNIYLYIKI